MNYKMLSKYMLNYHRLCDWYINRPHSVNDLQYRNICDIAKGITAVYNDSSLLKQQVIKLTWWDKENLLDDVICDVIGIKQRALLRARTSILDRLASEIGYV
ncbi:hypothetical protein ACN0YM_01535 [Staphylococcus cohnii]|uniref:hypothetical protein n=1 Tax=Staphylococcus cohnii TaxID=29382 RepID=UPI003AF5E0E4